jgi:prolyl 4-hydroxylase
MWLSAALLLLIMSLSHVLGGENSYGADKSWPIHHPWTNTSEPLNEDCKTAYERFMIGCGSQNVNDAAMMCKQNEKYRLKLSLTQPSSMVNFTDTGYSKVRASESLRKLLTEHFERNKDDHRDEEWTPFNVYINHWKEDRPYLVSLDNDETLKEQIQDYTKNVLEHWTGMELRPVSLYGIRVYTNGEFFYWLFGCWIHC